MILVSLKRYTMGEPLQGDLSRLNLGMVFRRRSLRIVMGIFGCLAFLILAVFISSYFLDGVIRSRTGATMNAKLKGYQVTLNHAHLQLIGGVLTLRGLTIVQLAHPAPPIMVLPMMRFHIQWHELLIGKVVADLLLWHPVLHIVEPQLVAQEKSPVKLKNEGWQDAVEAVYPFKINRLTIVQGDVTYVQDTTSPPLHLSKLDLVTENIRNIRSSNTVYPSTFQSSMVIFGIGHAAIDGSANYLEKPFPGIRAQCKIDNVPLKLITPEIKWTNFLIGGGRLSSEGTIEYSPKGTDLEINTATIDAVKITYVHEKATAPAEVKRVKETGEAIKRQNNRPRTDFIIRHFNITHSDFYFWDKSTSPDYKLSLEQTMVSVQNLSNHRDQGPASLNVTGKFMGSGNTTLIGWFLASGGGPAFNTNLAIRDTNLTSLNDLLRAYGRFNVAAGRFSLFSQMAVQNKNLTGYVKPMFSNVEVYSYEKDKKTGVLHQAKEIGIGILSHIFRNQSTQKVATQADLNGKLSQPNVSTWQAVLEVVRNAFIQAILPGFDRASGVSTPTGH